MNTSPLFSIIIITLNEEQYVKKILSSLVSQTYKDFEVILVDADSEDKTIGVIKSFSKDLPLRIFTIHKRNLSASRNLGAEHARGRYLFFIDADNTINSNFLEESYKLLKENSSIDVIIPRIVPSNNKLTDKIFFVLSFYFLKPFLYTNRPFTTGPNILVKKDIFSKVHGFDENVYVGEDHDIIRRFKKHHAKMVLLYNLVVVFSTRRFDQEGAIIYIKYAYAWIYQLLFSKVKNHIYDYKMGGHNFSKTQKNIT